MAEANVRSAADEALANTVAAPAAAPAYVPSASAMAFVRTSFASAIEFGFSLSATLNAFWRTVKICLQIQNWSTS